MFNSGVPRWQIARKLGRSRNAIVERLLRLGLEDGPSKYAVGYNYGRGLERFFFRGDGVGGASYGRRTLRNPRHPISDGLEVRDGKHL